MKVTTCVAIVLLGLVADGSARAQDADPNDDPLHRKPAAPSAAVAAPVEASKPKTVGNTGRTLGWVATGAGGAMLGVGVLALVMQASKKQDLDAACPNNVCPPGARDTYDSYNLLANIALFDLIGGAVVLAGGVYLLHTNPATSEPKQARLQPWIGLGSAGLRGTF